MRHIAIAILTAALTMLTATRATACPAGVNASCPAMTCSDMLNGAGYADDLVSWPAVCGSPEYGALASCASSACSAIIDSTDCGTIPGGDTVADVLTKWWDSDLTVGTGIPAACYSCLAASCNGYLRACDNAGC